MFQAKLRASVAQVGQALKEPEAFALRWHREGTPYEWPIFAALAATAILGTTTYGMIMSLLAGPQRMFAAGLYCTLAAGVGWSLPLPALYILNSLAGSRLRASTTFLAALVTTSWGGLAMIASIPVSWFFSVALPFPTLILIVHLAVFTAVGIAMIDVFCRVIASLEPSRGKAPAW